MPGLYFLGLPWQTARGSALLGFVGADAAMLAARLADDGALLSMQPLGKADGGSALIPPGRPAAIPAVSPA